MLNGNGEQNEMERQYSDTSDTKQQTNGWRTNNKTVYLQSNLFIPLFQLKCECWLQIKANECWRWARSNMLLTAFTLSKPQIDHTRLGEEKILTNKIHNGFFLGPVCHYKSSLFFLFSTHNIFKFNGKNNGVFHQISDSTDYNDSLPKKKGF